jgi:glycosyltransferase involved in cell wall biosynthesis
MPRLFFCTYSHTPWGGIESWLSGIAAYLAGNGWEVNVGLAQGREFNDPAAASLRFPGLPTLSLDGRTGTPEGRTRALCRTLRRVGPDVVVPVGLGEVFPAVARLKASGFPLRLVVPTRATNPELFHDIQSNRAIIDRLIGVNPLHVAYFLGNSTIPHDRAESIINGVELPPVCRKARDADDPLRIAFVGRLHESHKRVGDLVPFVKALSGLGVPFRLSIVGSGECQPALTQALAAEVARGAVRFLGYVSPTTVQGDILPHQDVLVSFSPSEGCPQAIQQALAHGVVPVCSEFLGVHSLGFLRDEETALLFPVGDAAAAARQVERLAENADFAEQLSRSGRSAAETFPLEWSHKRWHRAFQETLSLPVRGLEEPGTGNLGWCAGRGGRLERFGFSVGAADWARRLFRRWPRFEDGWAEWPGTLSRLDEAGRKTMREELIRLDAARRVPARPNLISH